MVRKSTRAFSLSFIRETDRLVCINQVCTEMYKPWRMLWRKPGVQLGMGLLSWQTSNSYQDSPGCRVGMSGCLLLIISDDWMCRGITLLSALYLLPSVLWGCLAFEHSWHSVELRRTGCLSFLGCLAGRNGIMKEKKELGPFLVLPENRVFQELWDFSLEWLTQFQMHLYSSAKKMDAFKSWLFDSLDYLWFFFPPLEWMIESDFFQLLCQRKTVSRNLKILCCPFQHFPTELSIMLYLSAAFFFNLVRHQ